MSPLGLLGQMDVLHPTVAPGRATGLLTKDIVVIVVTGLLLAVGLIVWAKFFWKGSRHKRSHHRHQRHENAVERSAEPETEEGVAEEDETSGGRQHRRRRRRVTRRDHRQRNPSLAETGGLPPKREEGAPPPAGI